MHNTSDKYVNANKINNAIKGKKKIKKIMTYKYINEISFYYIMSC